MPCKPTFFGPSTGVAFGLTASVFSSPEVPVPPFDVSLVGFGCPHHPPPFELGDWLITGLLCTLSPGETARRFIDARSKSSSRRRLLPTLRDISATVGKACASAWLETLSEGFRIAADVEAFGESIPTSLTPEELLARLPNCGGGVCMRLLLYKLDQNSFCAEPRRKSVLTLLELVHGAPLLVVVVRPRVSMSDIEPSCGMAGMVGVRSGDGGAVVDGPQLGPVEC